MAHFIGKVQGSHGMTSRLGTKKSGMHGMVAGWSVGLVFEARHREDESQDAIIFGVTNGTTYHYSNLSFEAKEGKLRTFQGFDKDDADAIDAILAKYDHLGA